MRPARVLLDAAHCCCATLQRRLPQSVARPWVVTWSSKQWNVNRSSGSAAQPPYRSIITPNGQIADQLTLSPPTALGAAHDPLTSTRSAGNCYGTLRWLESQHDSNSKSLTAPSAAAHAPRIHLSAANPARQYAGTSSTNSTTLAARIRTRDANGTSRTTAAASIAASTPWSYSYLNIHAKTHIHTSSVARVAAGNNNTFRNATATPSSTTATTSFSSSSNSIQDKPSRTPHSTPSTTSPSPSALAADPLSYRRVRRTAARVGKAATPQRGRFVDAAKLRACGGQGGAGRVAYEPTGRARHLAAIGGTGGPGGDVIVRASRHVSSLYGISTVLVAGRGGAGGTGGQTGVRGPDRVIEVPMGTTVRLGPPFLTTAVASAEADGDDGVYDNDGEDGGYDRDEYEDYDDGDEDTDEARESLSDDKTQEYDDTEEEEEVEDA
ncbi:hypothetical protein Agub_g7882, partial [Astrephomene gubernaculifera]